MKYHVKLKDGTVLYRNLPKEDARILAIDYTINQGVDTFIWNSWFMRVSHFYPIIQSEGDIPRCGGH